MSSARILVIRGGAIGDFILTLPALALLRENFPRAHIELLAYPHIASIANQRHYADAVRSIEYGPLAGFFNPRSDLDNELEDYFAGFGQIISYLYDPDGFFEFNLRRCGVKNLIVGNPLITGEKHAARQLAEPLEKLALFADDTPARLHPNKEDTDAAREILRGLPGRIIAMHPGSGSPKKNWPVAEWMALGQWLLQSKAETSLAIVAGESDSDFLAAAQYGSRGSVPHRGFAGNANVRFLENLPLPVLAATLGNCAGFVGHDSGISHLAAAAGCRSLLLFGPTRPEIWAPRGNAVSVLASPTGRMADLTRENVREAFAACFGDEIPE